jgi:DNA polymerase (family 10)
MENSDFAGIFWQMAEFLELKEDNPFKIRAYQRAAMNIESLSKPLEVIYKEGGLPALEAIPGVGKAIAGKIEELIKTGKLKAYDELEKKFPKNFVELMKVPGMGPKTAVMLKKKMKIDSVEKLESAAKKGLLRNLPGMGEKKEQNILKGVEQHKRHISRFLLPAALAHAESIINYLKKIAQVKEALPAGSLRRMKETIGDIDILVISKEPEKVIEHFVKFKEVERVLAKGETKSSVVLRDGMQADVRVLPPDEFGAALHYFTGNKQHNILLRELAIKKGMKLSEYGLFKGKKRIAGKTEEEIFKALSLPFIPPDIRHGTGEIEAAKNGKLPILVDIKNIRGDLHVHTNATDGNNSIEEMAEAAKRLGYEYIAITDHTTSARIAGGLSERELFQNLKKIDDANKKIMGITILKGAEVDISPEGKLDYSDSILKELDVVIAAVHSKFTQKRDEMTGRIIKAMENKYVNILAHPTGRLLGMRDPYEVDMEKVLEAAGRTGTFIELNAQPTRLDLFDIYCREARNMGILIAINTDAHSTSQFDNMKWGIATARRGWLEKKDVLNTMTLEKLLKKLKEKRS